MELGIGSRIRHLELGVGIVLQNTTTNLIISYVNHGVKEQPMATAGEELEIIEAVPQRKDLVSLSAIEETLREIVAPLTDEFEEVALNSKWEGGTLIFQPGNEQLKPYELKIDTFFHKIVMVRDKLRVLEQRINSSSMQDEEKVNLQQYITRVYGSLTSFNILFSDRKDGFSGSRK